MGVSSEETSRYEGDALGYIGCGLGEYDWAGLLMLILLDIVAKHGKRREG